MGEGKLHPATATLLLPEGYFFLAVMQKENIGDDGVKHIALLTAPMVMTGDAFLNFSKLN